MRKRMGHNAVSATQASSVTLYIRQHGAKESYSKFASFKMVVKTNTSMIHVGSNTSTLNIG